MRWFPFGAAILTAAILQMTKASFNFDLSPLYDKDGADMDSPDPLKDLAGQIKDGVDLGNAMLMAVQWPFTVGLSILNTFLGTVGAFITWFTFLVGFLRGGAGMNLLSWLRSDPPAMGGGDLGMDMGRKM